MCLNLTKHVRKVRNNLRDEYRSLAQNTMKLLMALFAFLSYASEIRPFVISSLGIYFGGFLDCTVIALLLLATVFYVRSKWRWKDKNQIKFGSRFEWGWTPSSHFFLKFMISESRSCFRRILNLFLRKIFDCLQIVKYMVSTSSELRFLNLNHVTISCGKQEIGLVAGTRFELVISGYLTATKRRYEPSGLILATPPR